MKVNFPEIKISDLPKKVYSVDLSGGGQEPFSIKLNYIDTVDSPDYVLNTIDPITVTIGNFFNFTGYAVAFSKKQSVSSGVTSELTLVDTSIILDKLFIGLKGKYGGDIPILRRTISGQPTAVPPEVNLNSLYSARTVDQTVEKLTTYRSNNNSPNIIYVGSYIDPCADKGDQVEDGCDPCSATEIANIDCGKSRLFEILDVDYTFDDLINACKGRVTFINAPTAPSDYRNQYTGTLREVLNNWCQDFGWSFYWEDGGVNIINLSNGINIDNLDLVSEHNCKIEEFSKSESIEGISKPINIAYFGKAGEVKNYTCSGGGGGGGGATSTSDTGSCSPITINELWSANGKDNSPLQSEYKDLGKLKRVMALSRLGEQIRRVYVYYDMYNFTSSAQVKVGPYRRLGWQIKAVVTANPDTSQVGTYQIGPIRSLFALLSTSYEFLGKKFLEGEFKQFGYYFLIIKVVDDGGFEFEKTLCEKFSGGISTNRTKTEGFQFSSQDGDLSTAAPDLNIKHRFIRSNEFIRDLHNEKDIVTIKSQVEWESNPDDDAVVTFLEKWSTRIRKIDNLPLGAFELDEGDEVWMIPGGTFPRDYGDIGVNFPSVTTKSYQRSRLDGGGGGNYSQGPTILLMPKIEIVSCYENKDNSNFTSVRVNYQNITNNSLSNIVRGNRSCFIDESRVKSYQDGLMNSVNQNLSIPKITKNYSILGLPNKLYKFKDGLVSFSIRLDQSGTRSSLSFSNLPPSITSDSVKKNQLNYLVKNPSNRSYINNTFK